MSVSLLAALLWIPFGIVVAIAGAIFLMSGYKRGLWRALISTGATVVATVVSMLLAKLLANPLSSAVLNVLPEMDSDGGITAELLTTLVKGVVGVVLSLALFSLFLLIFSIVLKCVTNRIQNDKLNVDKKSLRWAGLGVRVIDTVLFALLLLLPLYGTIATYMPTVQVVMQMQEKPDSETQAYIDAVASHPVVQMSGSGPAEWVYTGLSEVQMQEGSVNIADMAQTVDGLVKRVEKISTAEASQIPQLAEDLISYTRKHVIEQPWCYDLTQEMLAMAKQAMAQELSPEDRAQMNEMMGLLEMSREEFKENGIQILDFASYILQLGVIDNEEAAKAAMQSDEFLTRTGDLINSTRQAVAAKNLLIRSFVQDEIWDGNAQAAEAFLANRLSSEATEASLRKQEAAAIVKMTEARTREEYIEVLTMLPGLNFTEADADLLPENIGFFGDVMNGMNALPGEGGAVSGIIRDENGNTIIMDASGNPIGTVITDGEGNMTVVDENGNVVGNFSGAQFGVIGDEEENAVIGGSNIVVIG